jgi:hypothetical protein
VHNNLGQSANSGSFYLKQDGAQSKMHVVIKCKTAKKKKNQKYMYPEEKS